MKFFGVENLTLDPQKSLGNSIYGIRNEMKLQSRKPSTYVVVIVEQDRITLARLSSRIIKERVENGSLKLKNFAVIDGDIKKTFESSDIVHL